MTLTKKQAELIIKALYAYDDESTYDECDEIIFELADENNISSEDLFKFKDQ